MFQLALQIFGTVFYIKLFVDKDAVRSVTDDHNTWLVIEHEVCQTLRKTEQNTNTIQHDQIKVLVNL